MNIRIFIFLLAFLIVQPSSAQLFGEQQIITMEADHASSVYAADLDGDGDMDVRGGVGF